MVDGDGVVVAGNGSLEAARRLGWTHLAVADTTGMTAEEVRAFALADNRTAELSAWDYGVLHAEMQAGAPLEDLGWTREELAAVLPLEPVILPQPTSPLDRPSGASQIVHTCPKCGHEFR